MAILKDEEEQKGQGTSQFLGQAQQPAQAQQEEPQQPMQSSATIGASPSQPSTIKAMPKQQKAGTGTFANLRSYLQAAQGGGQQKVAQAATQQVQRLGAGAQKGIQQAQETFGKRMEAGSLSGISTPGGESAVKKEAEDIIKAARGVTYQAPVQQQATVQAQSAEAPETIEQSATTPQPVQPQQYFTPEQQQRFAEIINARYQGPESLQQAGLYEQAAKKARTAQEAAKLTQSAAGRQQLLKDVFGRTRDYSGKLDALLLNTSQEGVQQLQEQAKPALTSQQALQEAQNLTANLASQRKAAIEGVSSGAREAFTGARSEEETGVESRINKLIQEPALDEEGKPIPKLDAEGKPIVDAEGKPTYLTEWERLPEYFRQSLANKEKQTKAIQQEALAELQTQYQPQIEAESQLNLEKNTLNKKLDSIKRAISSLSLNIFNTPNINTTAQNKKREELQKQADQISGKLNEVNTQIGQLQSTPEFQDYKQKLSNANSMNLSQWTLSPEEAAILGISAGEGLYNINPEDIRTAQAERQRLITKDELSRQLALQQLAGLDTSRQLQKDLLYTDLEKAGTQDLASSLDVDSFRKLLDESQQRFKESAEGATLTGTGKKKVSRGNWSGKKTKTYYAQQQGNVADMLRQAGYDVSAESPEAAKSLLSNRDLLNKYLQATSTSRDSEGSNIDQLAKDAAIGMATAGTPIGMTKSVDFIQGLLEELGLQGASEAIGDVRNIAASPFTGIGNIAGSNVVGDIFRGVGGAIRGIDTGEMKSHGTGKAKQIAIKDLQKKYEAYLKGQGFENRANIADTEATRARSAALQQLLRRQG